MTRRRDHHDGLPPAILCPWRATVSGSGQHGRGRPVVGVWRRGDSGGRGDRRRRRAGAEHAPMPTLLTCVLMKFKSSSGRFIDGDGPPGIPSRALCPLSSWPSSWSHNATRRRAGGAVSAPSACRRQRAEPWPPLTTTERLQFIDLVLHRHARRPERVMHESHTERFTPQLTCGTYWIRRSSQAATSSLRASCRRS